MDHVPTWMGKMAAAVTAAVSEDDYIPTLVIFVGIVYTV